MNVKSIFCLVLLNVTFAFAQGNSTVVEDGIFQDLLKEKVKSNAAVGGSDRYKIQIFNGDHANAKKVLNDFKKENKLVDATIIFHTPTYKVWVGFYKNRIDAERNLSEIRKKYTSSFVIKPSKN
jgi:hypothetical protein